MPSRFQFLVTVETTPGTTILRDDLGEAIKEQLEDVALDLNGLGDEGDKDFDVVSVTAIDYPTGDGRRDRI